MKEKILNSTTFVVAHDVATDLHFSLVNVAVLYSIFTLGIVSIVPGASRFTSPAQIALGKFAYMVGTKE